MEKYIFIFQLWWVVVITNPTGAPDEACTSMTPIHGVSSQNGISPFYIQTPSRYIPGLPVTVTITYNPNFSQASNHDLKGMLLQARNNNNTQQNYILGKFYSHDGDDGFKGKTCVTKSSEDFTGLTGPNSITHSNNNNKNLPIILSWITHENVGPIVFVATFVSEKNTFWTFQQSQTILADNPATCSRKLCANNTCINTWEYCPEDPCPIVGEYRCLNGTCGLYRCNDKVQCSEGEDEKCCFDKEFQCASDKKCIHTKYVCDDFPDCSSLDDESGCSEPIHPCLEEEFHCGSNKCVPLHYVCDGESDCRYGIDEENCPVTASANSTSSADSVLVPVVAGVVTVVIVITIVIVVCVCICVVVKKRSKPNAPQTNSLPIAAESSTEVQTNPQQSGVFQTLDLQPGVYPPKSGTSGFANLGYVSPDHVQSDIDMLSQPYKVQQDRGVYNLGFSPENPPTYEQAISNVNNPYMKKIDSRKTPNQPTQYNNKPFHYSQSESIQNYENSAYENTMASSSTEGINNNSYSGNYDANATTSIKIKPSRETII